MGHTGKRRGTPGRKPKGTHAPAKRQGKGAGARTPQAGACGPKPARTPGSRSPAAPAAQSVSSEARTLCPIARECGGCSQLGVPYDSQLQRKDRAIAALFAELTAEDCAIEPIAGMEDPYRFRNKIASPFAPASTGYLSRSGRKGGIPRSAIACGLYQAGTHRIIPVDECPVEHPAGRRVIAAVRDLMARYGMEPYDEDLGTGFVRYVVVRVGHESDEVLVTIVTASAPFTGSRNFCRELVKRCPEVTTVVQNVNPRITNAILGTEERVLYGPGFIIDHLCGLGFRISSHSFFQVNALQTEVLYRVSLDFADLGAAQEPTVVDAYCGTGTIGLAAAAQCPGAHVIGVDKVASAIADAKGNAVHNGIGNAEFIVEDAGSFMRRLAAEGRPVDVLFMDPPRAGATPEFLDAAATLAPARIVYISCNPDTQVRDVKHLARCGYALRRLRPVDMFPHTDHIENVILLEKHRET